MTNTLTSRMELFPDGRYHGRTGEGREIVVLSTVFDECYQGLQSDETYPGQATFWVHDPETWIGGVDNKQVWYKDEKGTSL